MAAGSLRKYIIKCYMNHILFCVRKSYTDSESVKVKCKKTGSVAEAADQHVSTLLMFPFLKSPIVELIIMLTSILNITILWQSAF